MHAATQYNPPHSVPIPKLAQMTILHDDERKSWESVGSSKNRKTREGGMQGTESWLFLGRNSNKRCDHDATSQVEGLTVPVIGELKSIPRFAIIIHKWISSQIFAILFYNFLFYDFFF